MFSNSGEPRLDSTVDALRTNERHDGVCKNEEFAGADL